MKYDEFLARVRERGEFKTPNEAASVSETVLGVLAERISPGEVQELASELPPPLGQTVAGMRHEQAESFGVEEFYRRVSQGTRPRPRTAEWDASAVLTTVGEAISGGELNQIISQLPSGYAVLFGKAELAD
ncbi:DUF2267 domain-containing protein [Streptomyces sp. NPDC020801]|uniref:DUF2267 domain-containing protein n=1 Tax=unclassified Streptomyces TaxID=2593676 RepID=UPI003795FFF4